MRVGWCHEWRWWRFLHTRLGKRHSSLQEEATTAKSTRERPVMCSTPTLSRLDLLDMYFYHSLPCRQDLRLSIQSIRYQGLSLRPRSALRGWFSTPCPAASVRRSTRPRCPQEADQLRQDPSLLVRWAHTYEDSNKQTESAYSDYTSADEGDDEMDDED